MVEYYLNNIQNNSHKFNNNFAPIFKVKGLKA